jgi:RNA polymerase sigma factor (sigma-70 family)
LSPPDLYLAHKALLEGVIASVCRRHRLSSDDTDEFSGEFRLRLVQEDYAILRRFEGRSSLRTYLTVVVARAFQDWRNARWGRWRSSAEAKRLGALAVLVERLVVRDHHSLDEVEEFLDTTVGAVPRASLEAIVAKLPQRTKRRFVAADALTNYASPAALPDIEIDRQAGMEASAIAMAALRDGLQQMSPADRVVLRMRFHDGLTIAAIARALHLEQKPLYRRIERVLCELRESIERAGLTSDVAVGILAAGGLDVGNCDAAGALLASFDDLGAHTDRDDEARP